MSNDTDFNDLGNKNPIAARAQLTAISGGRSRRKGSKKGNGGGDGGGGKSDAKPTVPFFSKEGYTYRLKETRDGAVAVPLARFEATIAEERIGDDGMREDTRFMIRGSSPGGPLPEVEVPANRFGGMSWVMEAWGNQAILMPGTATKDSMRAAIQMLSGDVPTKRIYEHIGCRKINGEWRYLHVGGALGTAGNDESVTVDLSRYDPGGRMAFYQFPAPLSADALRDAIRETLELVELSARSELGYLLLSCGGRAPMSGIVPADFAVHLAGRTGTMKSEAVALVQQFWGRSFSSRGFVATWDDTKANRSSKTFAAKDAVLVVDDFRPKGTAVDVARLHADADDLVRSAGNQAGRGRNHSSMRAMHTYYPRCLILSTGEDIPKGHSLRARMLVYEVEPGEIKTDVLTRLQAAGREGRLAAVMRTYIQWMLERMEGLGDELREELQRLRSILPPFHHARGIDIYGNLVAGLKHFLDFAHEAGAIDVDTRDMHKSKGDEAFKKLMQGQGALQQEADEVSIFFTALRSAFFSGRAHLCDAASGTEPKSMPHAWGWRSDKSGEAQQWISQGDLVGYIDDENVYLDPGSVFPVAGRIAREQGQPITVGMRTLFLRIREQGHLVKVEGGAKAYVARKYIRGVQDRYAWFAVKTLRGSS